MESGTWSQQWSGVTCSFVLYGWVDLLIRGDAVSNVYCLLRIQNITYGPSLEFSLLSDKALYIKYINTPESFDS